jgi:signal transduction histidine kinase
VRREGDLALLEVQDQGIGIPSDELGRIFERFQRASNVHGRIGGTGIGLASVRHIVESHGGTIVVHSQERAGSSFQVRLPLGHEAGD